MRRAARNDTPGLSTDRERASGEMEREIQHRGTAEVVSYPMPGNRPELVGTMGKRNQAIRARTEFESVRRTQKPGMIRWKLRHPQGGLATHCTLHGGGGVGSHLENCTQESFAEFTEFVTRCCQRGRQWFASLRSRSNGFISFSGSKSTMAFANSRYTFPDGLGSALSPVYSFQGVDQG